MQSKMSKPQVMAESQRLSLRDRKVRDLVVEKRRLVEVPYTASLAHTINALVANRVVAVPVAAPPGQWIGAGGSMIMESDKQTGVVRKHYIGMVTMLDILAHIAEEDAGDDGMDSQDCVFDVDRKIILDCMEVLSKGIHRALVPLDSHIENATAGVELVESSTSYRMLTQMDVLRFLKEQCASKLEHIISCSVAELRAVSDQVFAVSHLTRVIDAIKSMRAASLNAVPIVEASADVDHKQIFDGQGRKLLGTFSSTDLRGCPTAQFQAWLPLNVLDLTEKVSTSALYLDSGFSPRELITCQPDSNLSIAIDKAVTRHVHRVWVVDHLADT
ncbi:hypothetical protein RJ641_024319 [Dillenia turbinata]|uniref:CBS domain-containing protein n=1 Tax=Dillenia turbinata TaxID=194707 RepID=A0AAN8YTB7_9MAGN